IDLFGPEKRAVEAALKNSWPEAIILNLQILAIDSNNIDALSRLGLAYLREGKWKKSQESYQRVLGLDHYNSIALKNLKKLRVLAKKKGFSPGPELVHPESFLEEPGRTKLLALVNLASPSALSRLTIAQEVFLKIKRKTVIVVDDKDEYLGALPDDLSSRLLRLFRGGNRYTATIKSVGPKSIYVFLRENSRGKRFVNFPSFPLSSEKTPFRNQEENTGKEDASWQEEETNPEEGEEEVRPPEEEKF
ncbi:MAG: tetratricopeptide repeat protein, partial [bacterium]|nr:tetratricopeptide repeat protein [bacterium]